MVAYADVWRVIVDPERSQGQTLGQEWIDKSVAEIGLNDIKDTTKWYYDQWITTYGILKNGMTF